MRQVQLTDDGQLATLVSEAEAGESITILRGERPVAQIIPFPEAPVAMTADRLAAIEELKAIMDKGYDLGIVWNGREELYERGSDGE
ncbi:type II toxin-antitoxin system Phd/YefM family antitoxin [Granulicella aggregans]|jgi:antitoxin (DNA-binding transcriptional repressor) of toxin-antitoxin stability system|uniref:type II toxin-antitoxin system Phd/YefM family antitoxin n=1 Tax=Granulicella aggregans TaxID=474949 RepID=UPI0021E0078C|nr:hypothetical protein [Granulicella aggregans]